MTKFNEYLERFLDSKNQELKVGDRVKVKHGSTKFTSVIKSISGDQIELKGGTLVDSEMVTKIERKKKDEATKVS